MTDRLSSLRDWMFKGLLFEAEAERFRHAGIRVGADLRDVEAQLLEDTLAPFPIDLRNEALQMARLHALLYCFETAVRQLIKERLQEKHSVDWWMKGIPQKVQKFAEDRQKEAIEQSWLEGQKDDLLGFVEFGHLADIIVNNWDDFSI